MFHVNAWGLPYPAAAVGARLVLPGAGLDGQSLYELMEQEQVTFAAGVPTIWQNLLAYLRASQRSFTSLKRTCVGGAACPPSMITAFRNEFQVEVYVYTLMTLSRVTCISPARFPAVV
jgi:acyl-CoA synthetase (AMP-forming)/AMP-acid ligase II